MITINAEGAPVFVGRAVGGELGFTNTGQWQVDSATYIAWGTNAPTSLTSYRDGAIVTVDSAGAISITDGPNLGLWSIEGFALCAGICGLVLITKYVMTAMMAAGGVRGGSD